MAVSGRLVRQARSWRAILSPETLKLSCDHPTVLPRRLQRNRSSTQRICSNALVPRIVLDGHGPYSIFSAALIGLFGVSAVEKAYADADEAAAKPPLPSESSTNFSDLEEIAKKERQRIEELLKSKGIQHGSYPRFTIAVKGQKVTIKFQIPSACEIPQLIASLVSQIGQKVVGGGSGSDVLLRAWDSSVAWQLTFHRLGKSKETEENDGNSGDVNANEGDLRILIFRSLISSEKAEIEFIKKGSLSPRELDAFVSALQLAGEKLKPKPSVERKPGEGSSRSPPVERSVSKLESIGVRIYGLDEPQGYSSYKEISWENIAGYDQQKREIEDTILMALHSPQIYDDIARGTRCKFESNRPRAVLFEGPPGTGKTSCARVIANQAGVPLLYVPLEAVMSKYYGESERLLGTVFSLANELPNGAIIFLDEIDSFAAARDSEMHEATRRILSVLLRQIDGFEQDKKVVVIAATNRKEDLDPALISRFDLMIPFDLPDEQNRQEIASQYAKHLTKPELLEFAQAMEEMSGRDIRDVCQHAERSWASKIIRGQVSKDGEQDSLPPLQEYLDSTIIRQKALRSIAEQRARNQNLEFPQRKPRLCVG